jgi:hypothetical protein
LAFHPSSSGLQQISVCLTASPWQLPISQRLTRTSERALGAPEAGGSFGFASPDAQLGSAYVMNKLDFYLQNDPREKALRDAVYRAIARITQRAEVETVSMSSADG